VIAKLTLAADGTVRAATTGASSLQDPIVEDCLNEKLRAVTFPASTGEVVLKIPLIFEG
jgi:hypothetical protein